MRTGTCTAVVDGDTILLEGSGTRLRYCNVWAPALGSVLGDALLLRNRELVLGKTVSYLPNGHMHWEQGAIIADVYVDGLWVNHLLRLWLSQRMKAPVWRNGIPGEDNPESVR